MLVWQGNPQAPDFKHKTTKKALWINDRFSPSWLQAKLATLTQQPPQQLSSSSSLSTSRISSSQASRTWEEFFSDPSQWWDNRSDDKRNSRFPDFKHKTTKKALWIDNRSNPPWVHARLAMLQCRIVKMEQLWQEFFSDQSQWWDNRFIKKSSKHPDFKHKNTNEGLWIDDWLNPPWVKAKMATLLLGQIQSDGGLRTRVPDSFGYGNNVSKLCQVGRLKEALHMVELMVQQNTQPPINAYVGLLKGCARRKALAEGKQVHALIVRSGLDSDIFLGNMLVDMYAKCCSVLDARKVFNTMPEHNLFSWTAIISAYAYHGEGEEAINLFKQMQQKGIAPDKVVFLIVLKACVRIASLEQGKQLHSHIIKSGFESDVYVGCALVDMYAKCGDIEYAQQVFNHIHERNVVSWNALIAGYAQHGLGKEALALYKEMKEEDVQPDHVTFVVLVKACASIAALEEGMQLHSEIIKSGFDSNVIVSSALVDMYAKCGCIEDAREVFNNMHERDVVSWNAMIAGYAQHGLGKEALALYDQMKLRGVEPDNVTYIVLLKACASIAALEEGRQLHTYIIKSDFQFDVIVSSALVNMYAKCDCIQDAREVFNNMKERDVGSWNVMIAGYAQQGLGKEALALYEQMKQKGVQPENITYVVLLNACARIGALEHGKQLHSDIIKSGSESDIVIGNTLVDMYSKCGCIEDAGEVFMKMRERNVVSWTAMITGYVHQGLGKKALYLYEQMKQENVQPDDVTYVVLLNACASMAALEQGKQLHSDIIRSGFESDIAVGNALVDMYAKCGSIEHSRAVFNSMRERNVVSWNGMIAGYAQHSLEKEALALYKQMIQEGVQTNNFTFVLLLKACASIAALEHGKQLHAQIIKSGFASDVIVGSALVDMYAKCGCLEDAREVFDNIIERDLGLWNAVIAGYVQQGLQKEALALYEQMKQEGVQPDNATYVVLLKACARIGALERSKQLHCDIIRSGFESDVIVGTTLVDMYAKCGCIEDARNVFIKIDKRDVVSWTAMIAGYAQQGLGMEALGLYEQMKHEGMQPDNVTYVALLNACASSAALEQGKQLHSDIIRSGFESDVTVGNTLVNMYAKCGSIEHAREVFNNMHERNVASWNAMIAGYAQRGFGKEAFTLYEQMKQEGVLTNDVVFVVLIKACASIAALEQGKQLHSDIIKTGFESNVYVNSALVDMYAKCGCIEDAREVFDNMRERDVVSWNGMIAGYAQQGLGQEALTLLEQMQREGTKPNEATYASVLSACSHCGLVDEGRHLFDSMCKDHGLTPTVDHYACMVDLLGRAGCLADAETLINEMPIQPDPVVWMTLLGAARNHGHVDIGRRAFDSVLKLEPENAAAHVLLSNIYAAAGRKDEVPQIRNEGWHEKKAWMQLD
ncbi:hypothetical protein O6H91_10G061300 [Diphasiastrum complanatum]|uniref:Uncharacterized protein n=1 Tax=Diphasiastrum complanatum TaxID=34168 RepID=A0ACC2CHJ6_DIPCM|nr:hypothetical protein O6H91_10G061300 [Diphasiastrum complanatum]